MTRANLVLLLLLAFAVSVFASEYLDRFDYTVSGNCTGEPVTVTVKDHYTSKPVRAQVRFQIADPRLGFLVETYFNWTDQDTGRLAYAPVAEGRYRVTISRPGYSSEEFDRTVEYCPQCRDNSGCNRTSICVDFTCVPVTGECGHVVEQAWVPYECCDDSACASSQVCINAYCTNLTGRCGRAQNHTWYNYECCVGADCASGMDCVDHACMSVAECATNVDCQDNARCASGDCVVITGDCGVASNHRWIQWQCCSDMQCGEGMRCSDIHTCGPAPTPVPTPAPLNNSCGPAFALLGAGLLAVALKR